MNQQIRIRTENKIQQNQKAQAHTVNLNGRNYSVFTNVFSPAIFLGTEWLTNAFIKHAPQKSSVIEVGVGCGCTLVEMLLSHKFTYVLGVDINQSSVDNTIANLKEYGLETDVYQSDVLDNQKISTKVDTVYWNYPFHPSQKNWEELSEIEKGVMDPNYCHLKKLIDQSLQRKVKEIYLGFSLTMGDFESLKQILALKSLKFQILEQMDEQKGTICLIKIQLS